MNMYVQKKVDISMMVMGDDSGIKGYGRRRSELSNAPLLMKQDTPNTPV
tara:strand:- start:56 stop:202 length:147 start_codon:yes stop_codon:yes gene_type:complete